MTEELVMVTSKVDNLWFNVDLLMVIYGLLFVAIKVCIF